MNVSSSVLTPLGELDRLFTGLLTRFLGREVFRSLLERLYSRLISLTSSSILIGADVPMIPGLELPCLIILY